MENIEHNTVKTILNNFIEDYAKRDTNVEFSEWLSGKLQEEIQSLDDNSGKKLVDKIIEEVLKSDKLRDELNQAVEDGKTKEKWFADKMAEAYAGMDVQEAGDVLSEFEHELSKADENLLYGKNDNSVNDYNQNDAAVEWNKYSVKDMLNRIARKSAVFGLGNVAKAMENKSRNVAKADVQEFEKKLITNCLKNDNSEVKAMIAGALEVAAKNKLDDRLPHDTPIEVICALASGIAEAAAVVVDLIDGNITALEAVDKIGRAGIAAVCKCAGISLKMVVSAIPYVGSICVDLLGEVFEYMETPDFANDVYKVLRDAAIATWEGLKENIASAAETVKNGMLQ
jgi:hypothetical protein